MSLYHSENETIRCISSINGSILENLNVGVIVLDPQNRVLSWNRFMAKHSGIRNDEIRGRDLFEVFTELPKSWLELKLKSVRLVKSFSFISWKQRPYLFKFKHSGAISSEMSAEYMIQDCTFVPVQDSDTGEIFVCITIQDMTDIALSQKRLEELTDVITTLEEITNHDVLTSMYNRGFIEKKAESLFNETKGRGTPFSIALFDLDHFKSINDHYGHLAGDEVLRQVSKKISNGAGLKGVAGRYGGEEFLLVLPGINEKGAFDLCEQLRKAVEEMETDYNGIMIKITISMGIAGNREDVKDYLQMIHEADIALYHSKNNGRNKVTIYAGKEAAVGSFTPYE